MKKTLLLTVTALLVSACHPDIYGTKPDVPGLKATEDTGPKYYLEPTDGITISTAPDRVINFDFDENPSTGFIWSVSSTDGLTEIETTYTSDPNPGGMVGVGGTRRFSFEATGEGEQTLSFTHSRGNGEVVDRREITVFVE